MNMPNETPGRAIPAGTWLVILTILLLVGLGFLGMRNLFSGVVLKPPPIVGQWQAYRAPWRIVFNPDKTLVSSTGPSGTDASQPWTSGPGTYTIDFFGTLWVTLNDGRAYTATLRSDWPNQFDLVDTGTDVVTVFERVLQLPPMPDDVPKQPPGR